MKIEVDRGRVTEEVKGRLNGRLKADEGPNDDQITAAISTAISSRILSATNFTPEGLAKVIATVVMWVLEDDGLIKATDHASATGVSQAAVAN